LTLDTQVIILYQTNLSFNPHEDPEQAFAPFYLVVKQNLRRGSSDRRRFICLLQGLRHILEHLSKDPFEEIRADEIARH
jgi:hypothetical protein